MKHESPPSHNIAQERKQIAGTAAFLSYTSTKHKGPSIIHTKQQEMKVAIWGFLVKMKGDIRELWLLLKLEYLGKVIYG